MSKSRNQYKAKQLYIDRVNPNLSPIRALRSVHGLHRARSILHLSQNEFGEQIARLTRYAEPIPQAIVSCWESGKRKMPRECIDAVGRLLATWLYQQLRRDDIGIKVAVNSPWRITTWARCSCNRWYELRQAKQTKCGKCKRK